MCLVVGTLFLYGTTFTFRCSCCTEVSSEKNKRVMKYRFLRNTENTVYCLIGLFGRFGRDDTDTIHDSMDMRIYSHIGHIIEHREDDFRCLDSDARKGLYELEIVRKDSVILFC